MNHCFGVRSWETQRQFRRGQRREGGETEFRSESSGISPIQSPTSTINLTNRAYHIAVRSESYTKIWYKIHRIDDSESTSSPASTILEPDKASISRALTEIPQTKTISLISDYFDYSEHTNHLCIDLHYSIGHARTIYDPLKDILLLPPPEISIAFGRFQIAANPFPELPSRDFDTVQHRLQALRDLLNTEMKRRRWRRKSGEIMQMEEAAKGAFVLRNELRTIERLVCRLHATVESNIGWLRMGERTEVAMMVVLELRRNLSGFDVQLGDLEQHLCSCLNFVNQTRVKLFHQVMFRRNTR